MGCPTREELEALFSGEPRDPARATAVLSHARECPICSELLRADGSSSARPSGPERRRSRYKPNLTIVGVAAVGLALVTFSRACARLTRPATAPVTSGSR